MTKLETPPRYKLALLTWAAAFPLLTLLRVLLNPLLARLPLPGQTAILTALLIVTMTYVIMPRLTSLFAGWLLRRTPSMPAGEIVSITEGVSDAHGCLSG